MTIPPLPGHQPAFGTNTPQEMNQLPNTNKCTFKTSCRARFNTDAHSFSVIIRENREASRPFHRESQNRRLTEHLPRARFSTCIAGWVAGSPGSQGTSCFPE